MKIVFAFFMSIVSLTAFSQQAQGVKDEALIRWSQDYKLKWSDFKGKVYGTSTAASCVVWHSSLKRTEGVFEVEYANEFDRLQSWMTDTTSSQLLNHEQLHFDINEVFCRKVRKGVIALIETDAISSEDLQVLVDSLSHEKDDYQGLFDKETAHGAYGLKQLEWRRKIDYELDSLKSYANTTIKEE